MIKISKHLLYTSIGTSLLALSACSAADKSVDAPQDSITQVTEVITHVVKDDVAVNSISEIKTIPSGLYVADSSHAYISFTYDHLGYSKPVLRWGSFDAEVALDAEDPAQSTVNVKIDAAEIDSGVDVFNDHLRARNFFDVENYPEITFESTSVDLDAGTLNGNLTIKDNTKPVTLNVTLNKAGEHFITKKPAFGISAKGRVMRSDFGVGAYAPNVSDWVDLTIEIEFGPSE